ncbi:helix-turn-helix domain-containing protein [Streptomyces sp. NRRL B-24484]|uniref:helix-turn-helix domain-containing protein n=1 Tax=Streptomyces sp. NRRL B-24484 TaxID=1463833 RepID=UPI001F26A484|nr:helix-turn-helix transcriptional regulator [Streptomyces sp. NRRL B-24484]
MQTSMAPLNEFGPELRKRRIAAGLTLTRLAGLLNYSKGHLSKIERGEKAPPPELARRCDAQLGAGGELERLLQAGHSRKARIAERTRTEPAEEPPLRGRYGGPPGGLRRRQLLAAGASSLFGGELAASLQSLATGTTSGKDVAAESAPVEIFRAQFDQMRRLGQTSAPSTLLPLLTVQTETLGRLAVQADAVNRNRLFLLAARFAEYAGWMAQEAGDNSSVLVWTARAVELAEVGSDRHLASYALVRRALVALYAGDAAATVQIVGPAQASSLPPRIRGLAAQREAQGHALAGDHHACMRSLDRARELLARADAEDAVGTPVLGTTTLADPAAMVTGWCLYDLGHAARAAEVLDRECLRLPSDAVRSSARYGLRRALAHAAAGEPERACDIASDHLPLVPELQSATIQADVRRLARELRRSHANRSVLNLQPLLAAALHP